MAVTLDPVLLSVLACPTEHHAPLTPGRPGDPDASALTCTECGRIFPIRDGIPVLLLDDAEGGPDADRAQIAAGGPDADRAQVADAGPETPGSGRSGSEPTAGTNQPGIAPPR